MPEHLSFWEKVIEIQKACNISKEQKGYGFKYRNKDDILRVVKPVLASLGLALYFRHSLEEASGRVFFVCEAVLTDGKESLSSRVPVEADAAAKKMPAQNSGSTITYAERYALNALFAVSDFEPDPEQEWIHADINESLNAVKGEKKTRTLDDMNLETARYQFQPLYEKYINRGVFSEADKKLLYGLYLNVVDPAMQMPKEKLGVKSVCAGLIKLLGWEA